MLDDIVSREEAETILGVSRSTFERMLLDGRAPEPFRIGQRLRFWKRKEIESIAKKRKKT